MLSPAGGDEGLRLVSIEPAQTQPFERSADARAQLLRERDDVRVSGGHLGEVRELLSGEKLVPGCGDGGHETRC
jgi:hypothetical protein